MKIAIIGAGFFGTTAALKLSKYHDVDLFEKKKDIYNIYENELHPKNVEEDEGIKDYTQFDGINDDWEEFNERDFNTKSKD